jgi:hypothetical protein
MPKLPKFVGFNYVPWFNNLTLFYFPVEGIYHELSHLLMKSGS